MQGKTWTLTILRRWLVSNGSEVSKDITPPSRKMAGKWRALRRHARDGTPRGTCAWSAGQGAARFQTSRKAAPHPSRSCGIAAAEPAPEAAITAAVPAPAEAADRSCSAAPAQVSEDLTRSWSAVLQAMADRAAVPRDGIERTGRFSCFALTRQRGRGAVTGCRNGTCTRTAERCTYADHLRSAEPGTPAYGRT
jgi:hypothetical protein